MRTCPGLQRAAFSLCIHIAFPCCLHAETERSVSLLIKALILSDEGCTFMTSINFSYKGSSSNAVTLRIRVSKYEFGRQNSVHNILLLAPTKLMSFSHAKYIHSILVSPKVLNHSKHQLQHLKSKVSPKHLNQI